jgi:hypothetical protein
MHRLIIRKANRKRKFKHDRALRKKNANINKEPVKIEFNEGIDLDNFMETVDYIHDIVSKKFDDVKGVTLRIDAESPARDDQPYAVQVLGLLFETRIKEVHSFVERDSAEFINVEMKFKYVFEGNDMICWMHVYDDLNPNRYNLEDDSCNITIDMKITNN